MNKILLAATAAIALTASVAQAQTIGHVGVTYARTNVDIEGAGDTDVNRYDAEGAVRFDVRGLGAQIDGALSNFEGDDVGSSTTYSLTGHLNTKLSGGALVGGFAGVDHTDEGDLTIWGLGLEGQGALTANDTLYGQVGYVTSHDLGDPNIWAARAELRHFFGDNVKLQGSAGYLNADTDFGDFDVWNVGVEGEYQFAGTPWSVLAGYDYAKSEDFDTTNNTFRVGVRYTFGGTLKARNDSGAELSPLSKLVTGAFGF